MTFAELNLPSNILRAIKDIGFVEPTDIQKQAIPHILNNVDIIGKSRTGTGKTAAFSIPIICRINKDNKRKISSLILCPTRELAIQVCDEIKKYGKYHRDINVLSVCGGQSYEKQIYEIKHGANIIVGTPGRIIDHINRGTLKLNDLSSIILDEADEMLNMGFIDDIEKILNSIPSKKQVILFSATMPKDILNIAKKYQNNPVLVDIENNDLNASLIEQFYCCLHKDDKKDALYVLLKYLDPKIGIIFCNTKKMVDELELTLSNLGFNAGGLHGDMKQSSRTYIMNKFKSGKINILIATDVAARGIDVSGVDVVINYDLPQDIEYYVHRVGRTGRAGKSGKSFTLINNSMQYADLMKIKNKTKFKIKYFSIPTPDELDKAIKLRFIDEFIEYLDESENKIYNREKECLNLILKKGYTYEQVCLSLISLVIPKNDEKIPFVSNVNESKYNKIKTKSSDDKFKRITLNIGKKHYSDKRQLIKFILNRSNINSSSLGKIQVLKDTTIIEVVKNKVDVVEKNIHNSIINNKIVKVLRKFSGSNKNRK